MGGVHWMQHMRTPTTGIPAQHVYTRLGCTTLGPGCAFPAEGGGRGGGGGTPLNTEMAATREAPIEQQRCPRCDQKLAVITMSGSGDG